MECPHVVPLKHETIVDLLPHTLHGQTLQNDRGLTKLPTMIAANNKFWRHLYILTCKAPCCGLRARASRTGKPDAATAFLEAWLEVGRRYRPLSSEVENYLEAYAVPAAAANNSSNDRNSSKNKIENKEKSNKKKGTNRYTQNSKSKWGCRRS